MSVAQAYRETVARNARLPAILRDDVTMSHNDLWDMSNSFARRMSIAGVDSNSIVALNTGDTIALLATLFATSILGAKFIVASDTLARSKIIKPTHFFRTDDAAGKKNIKFELIDNSWLPNAETRTDPVDIRSDPDLNEDWLYVHTTGSTGRPKFIALSEALVLARSAAVADDFKYREMTFASTFAATSRPFIARAVAALLNACAICSGKDVNFWKKSGVNLVCGAPGQLEHLFENFPPEAHFERVESSGAHLPDWQIRKLLEKFDTVVDVYGATETNKSFATTYQRFAAGAIEKLAHPRDSEIQIVATDGTILGLGKIGSVRVRNPYLAKGYLNDEIATAKSFRDGWFYPGDLASWGQKGELIIVGREDDVINLGGYKMNAGMLDQFFKHMPGIIDAIAFNNPKIEAVNKVLVFAVFEDEARKNEIIARICDLAANKMRFLLLPSCIRSVKTIPRTESGDPDRRACREMVARRAEIEIVEDVAD